MVPDMQKTQTVYNNKNQLKKKLGDYCVNQYFSTDVHMQFIYWRSVFKEATH